MRAPTDGTLARPLDCFLTFSRGKEGISSHRVPANDRLFTFRAWISYVSQWLAHHRTCMPILGPLFSRRAGREVKRITKLSAITSSHVAPFLSVCARNDNLVRCGFTSPRSPVRPSALRHRPDSRPNAGKARRGGAVGILSTFLRRENFPRRAPRVREYQARRGLGGDGLLLTIFVVRST